MNNSKKVIVLGGGLTGLAAGWKLAKSGTNVTVIEVRDSVGGLASTFSWRGFELDIGPHKLYSQSEDIRNFVISILGRELDQHWKKAGLWFRGRRIEFPLSIRDALVHFGWLFGEYFRHPRSVIDYLTRKQEVTYKDYVLNRFGFYLYEELFRPQATKLWGPPDELSAELGHVRMPFPNMYSAVFGTIWKKLGRAGNAEKFFYPKKGIGELSDRLAHDIVGFGGQLKLGRAPHEINLSNKGVTVALRDERLEADVLISTIAPNSFFRILQPAAPAEIVSAAKKLKFRSLIMCYLAISRSKLTADHWINFPEAKYSFNRIYEAKSFGIKGRREETIIGAEVSVDFLFLQSRADADIADSVVSDLVSCGLIKAEDVLDHKIVRISRAYPLLDLGYEAWRGEVLAYMHKQKNVLCAGRSGFFIYNSMDHSLEMGLAAADHVLEDAIASWPEEASKRFEGNRIID